MKQLWKPKYPWNLRWYYPRGYIEYINFESKKLKVKLTITKDIHESALESQKEWIKQNPAPLWWRIICRIFNHPTHIPVGEFGECWGAIPKIIDSNMTVILKADLAVSANTKLGKEDGYRRNEPFLTIKGHLIFDGGIKQLCNLEDETIIENPEIYKVLK